MRVFIIVLMKILMKILLNILFYEEIDHHFHENFNDNLNDNFMRGLMRIYDGEFPSSNWEDHDKASGWFHFWESWAWIQRTTDEPLECFGIGLLPRLLTRSWPNFLITRFVLIRHKKLFTSIILWYFNFHMPMIAKCFMGKFGGGINSTRPRDVCHFRTARTFPGRDFRRNGRGLLPWRPVGSALAEGRWCFLRVNQRETTRWYSLFQPKKRMDLEPLWHSPGDFLKILVSTTQYSLLSPASKLVVRPAGHKVQWGWPFSAAYSPQHGWPHGGSWPWPWWESCKNFNGNEKSWWHHAEIMEYNGMMIYNPSHWSIEIMSNAYWRMLFLQLPS